VDQIGQAREKGNSFFVDIIEVELPSKEMICNRSGNSTGFGSQDPRGRDVALPLRKGPDQEQSTGGGGRRGFEVACNASKVSFSR